MGTSYRSAISSMRSTIAASLGRGTVASSSSVSVPSRDSAGSAQRRASSSASERAMFSARVTSRAPLPVHCSPMRPRLRSTMSSGPSSPNSSSAPASSRSPRLAYSSTAPMHLASRNSSVAGTIPSPMIASTARPAFASDPKYATPVFVVAGIGSSATVSSVSTPSVPSEPVSSRVRS